MIIGGELKYLNEKENFLAIEEKYSNIEDSKIVIVPAGYEHTVSYGGGTALGPKAILDASAYVEFYDDEFNNELCFEKGICTLEPIDFGSKVDLEAIRLIEDYTLELIRRDKFIVTLGGEHTISQAPIKAHFSFYPKMSILQFDAHSDFRESYQGSKYSHASIFARVADFFAPNFITQVGIRALCKEEAQFIRRTGANTFFANAIRRGVHGENWQKAVVDTLNDEIYVSFDVDYFDPAIMPSTGTPEPDGFMYNETLEVFREIRRQGKRIIGFDVVELAPTPNSPHSDITTARLVYKMLNYAFAGKE